MEKSLAVANAMIQLAKAHGTPPTQMKLQKLIYFAHGWNLALYGTPLVDEQFQAWQYGPVIPSVYHEFKAFGTLGIDRLGTEMVSTACGFEWIPPAISDKTGRVEKLLDKVWEVFGAFSGTKLSEMTHAAGTPWTKMREKYVGCRDIPIPNDEIESYFKGLMKNGK